MFVNAIKNDRRMSWNILYKIYTSTMKILLNIAIDHLKFGDISNDEMRAYKKTLKGLLFLDKQNIDFLNDFYNRDKEEFEINE